jgi:hypothetical protein
MKVFHRQQHRLPVLKNREIILGFAARNNFTYRPPNDNDLALIGWINGIDHERMCTKGK